jgi:predicted RNA binding protein YcfA (HicA-like mRNA interferase family)
MLRLFEKAGWTKLRQKGSHVRVIKNGVRETIPMHKELKKGMESDLLKTLEKNK